MLEKSHKKAMNFAPNRCQPPNLFPNEMMFGRNLVDLKYESCCNQIHHIVA
ncbi:hypothetical protein TanjilG_13581 [Lupinus angustifolius]|uniref:Uncharacterized protein n=1 Tax=Lupinus angustifolius TaxID=3871 RepID=A0A1J7I0N8_LUPAN|nr:hypothetical protein TanjilG_13581 [Lupinus angustifolius]